MLNDEWIVKEAWKWEDQLENSASTTMVVKIEKREQTWVIVVVLVMTADGLSVRSWGKGRIKNNF